jgi:predicted flavoprotein YhiN
MCAMHAGYRRLGVLLLEKGPKAGLKLLVSGGGRCNFTNVFAGPTKQFLSDNPHFCISAVSRYRPSKFIDMDEARGIPYHEKTLGQLFCDRTSRDIIAMRLDHCAEAGAEIPPRQEVRAVRPAVQGGFEVAAGGQTYRAGKVLVASVGLSLPKIVSDLAFRTANKLGLNVVTAWLSPGRKRVSELPSILTRGYGRPAGSALEPSVLARFPSRVHPVRARRCSPWPSDADGLL